MTRIKTATLLALAAATPAMSDEVGHELPHDRLFDLPRLG